MLAWVHQAIAAEREFLEALFGVRGDGRMVGSVRQFAESVEEEWIGELMDAAVRKLCTPLKVRRPHKEYMLVTSDAEYVHRCACSKQCAPKRAASPHIRSHIYFNFICSQCSEQLEKVPF